MGGFKLQRERCEEVLPWFFLQADLEQEPQSREMYREGSMKITAKSFQE